MKIDSNRILNRNKCLVAELLKMFVKPCNDTEVV